MPTPLTKAGTLIVALTVAPSTAIPSPAATCFDGAREMSTGTPTVGISADCNLALMVGAEKVNPDAENL